MRYLSLQQKLTDHMIARMRTAPARRGRRPLEDLDEPDVVYRLPGAWFCAPRADADHPGKARWLELLAADPAAARREALEARMQYWARRVEVLERRYAEIRAWLVGPRVKPSAKRPWQPWHIDDRIERADVEEARARLAEVERELAQ